MTRVYILMPVIVFLFGCQTKETYVGGQSNTVELDWKSQIHLNKTTEKEIVDLLGQPNGYYHHTPNNGDKYLLYKTTSTLHTIHHLPFLPKFQFASQSKASVTSVWFFISKGIVTKQIQSEEAPDLEKFIKSSGAEFPYCDKIKCKQKKSN